MTKEQLKQRLELNSAMTQIAADYLRENACAIEREMVESLCHSCGLSETDAVYTLFCIIAGLELDENPLHRRLADNISSRDSVVCPQLNMKPTLICATSIFRIRPRAAGRCAGKAISRLKS